MITATISIVLLIASSLTSHAVAITVQECKDEVGAFKTAVNNLTSSDQKKAGKLDKFKAGLNKKIDMIVGKLDKGKLKQSLSMMKGLIDILQNRLTLSAMDTIKSVIPATMAAIGNEHKHKH